MEIWLFLIYFACKYIYMVTGLLHLHSVLRWVILILLLVAILQSWKARSSKLPFTQGNRKTALFLLISTHLNLLIGLYQLFAGRFGILNASLPEGESLMKNAFFRFYWIEHPFGMIVAVALITIGYSKVKKSANSNTFNGAPFILFLLALIIILATIPWPGRLDIGRPLFPGM